jgi:hypothetical protein
MEVYSRFTRFCMGTTSTENESILNQKIISLFSDSLVYVVGFQVSPSFIEDLFNLLLIYYHQFLRH